MKCCHNTKMIFKNFVPRFFPNSRKSNCPSWYPIGTTCTRMALDEISISKESIDWMDMKTCVFLICEISSIPVDFANLFLYYSIERDPDLLQPCSWPPCPNPLPSRQSIGALQFKKFP